MARRPAAIAFDMLQTVFSLEPLRGRLVELGLSESALEVWFAHTLRDGFALAMTGTYRPFAAVAAGTLRALATAEGCPLDSSQAAEVLDAFQTLPAQPDAAEAMAMVRSAGVRVLALTNGSQTTTQTLLTRSGLARYVEQTVSIDDVRAWKPRAEVYLHAARAASLAPSQFALVAAHAWDCHGAKHVGYTTGWVSRIEKVFQPAFDQPDVIGDDLLTVCSGLLELAD